MLRVLRSRIRWGGITEKAPSGGAALTWLPTLADPTSVGVGDCPTAALATEEALDGTDADPTNSNGGTHSVTLDLAACIFCKACERTGAVSWDTGLPAPDLHLARLTPGVRAAPLPVLQEQLRLRSGIFGRSLAIRHLDVGSCNGCDVEIHATTSPFVDPERFGIHFVASPRHADILLVTGVVTRNLAKALVATVDATPHPRAVVALGACALSGGIFADSPQVLGGAQSLVTVDIAAPGCPPPPEAILSAILQAAMVLDDRAAGRRPPHPPGRVDLGLSATSHTHRPQDQARLAGPEPSAM